VVDRPTKINQKFDKLEWGVSKFKRRDFFLEKKYFFLKKKALLF
jgi:hypothetical protein